jgi:hypothetical protein
MERTRRKSKNHRGAYDLPPDPNFNLLEAIAAWKRDVGWDETRRMPTRIYESSQPAFKLSRTVPRTNDQSGVLQ